MYLDIDSVVLIMVFFKFRKSLKGSIKKCDRYPWDGVIGDI